MIYAPSSRSFADGIIQGAKSERERIIELLDRYCYLVDEQGTRTIYSYDQLIKEIEREETDEN